MKQKLTGLFDKFLNKRLDFRVRLFNILAIAGIAVSLISAAVSTILKENPINAIVYMAFCTLSVLLLRYSSKSGRYQFCYLVTIVVIFLFGFPVFFFLNGAYYGTIPYFFVFAVVFTVFMIEGKKALAIAAFELILYSGLCLYAYFYFTPGDYYTDSRIIMIDTIFGVVVVGTALGVTMYHHFRLYNEQQRELSAARERLSEENAMLERLNRLKTEFLGDISHELKTPLTVISVHTQRAEAFLKLGREGDVEKIRESHALIQDEVMRLSRLVDGALALSSLQGHSGQKVTLDLCHILSVVAEAYRTLIEKRGNVLTLSLPDFPLAVYGSADEMTQLISNLLTNANAHTESGDIRISAEKSGETLLVTISDNGEGIAKEILPHVFERGVTDGGGNGLGLSICRQIANNHGGDIEIASEQGKGTTVIITFPEHKEADHA